jgi:RNA polymerase sigma-70 factor, ECF subfamily
MKRRLRLRSRPQPSSRGRAGLPGVRAGSGRLSIRAVVSRHYGEGSPADPSIHVRARSSDARLTDEGGLVRLAEQDRSRWHAVEIAEGIAWLMRADHRQPGPYAIQAAIAAEHASARTAAETDWVAIALLYRRLSDRAPSPVVMLNRAVAEAEADGPEAGLALLDGLDDALPHHPLVPATRAELLTRIGETEAARHQFVRALELTSNDVEAAFLRERLRALGPPPETAD